MGRVESESLVRLYPHRYDTCSIDKQLHRPKSYPKCNPPVGQPGLTRRISLSNPISRPHRSSLAASKKKRSTICGISRARSEGCQDQPGTRYGVAMILNQTLTLATGPTLGMWDLVTEWQEGVRTTSRSMALSTVLQSAHCPVAGHCWPLV